MALSTTDTSAQKPRTNGNCCPLVVAVPTFTSARLQSQSLAKHLEFSYATATRQVRSLGIERGSCAAEGPGWLEN